MSAWVKEHFRDEQHTRETLAKGAVIAAAVGFALVMVGVWLARG